jgi:hypothetical protein
MKKETLLSLALAQVQTYAEYFRQNDPDSAADDLRFETYARSSGVIDLFVVGDGGGFVSDTLFPVGYVTLRGAWVETFGCSDELPFEYFDGPSVQVGDDIVVPAVA